MINEVHHYIASAIGIGETVKNHILRELLRIHDQSWVV
jgi:hypothetical protein